MNVYEYTALNNPSNSAELVASYNVRPERNHRRLGKQLASLVNKYGEEALDKIASIHPDLPLFQKAIDDYKAKIKAESDSKQQAYNNFVTDGQALKNDVAYLKATGIDSSTATATESHKTRDLLIIGSVLLIGLAIVMKK